MRTDRNINYFSLLQDLRAKEEELFETQLSEDNSQITSLEELLAEISNDCNRHHDRNQSPFVYFKAKMQASYLKHLIGMVNILENAIPGAKVYEKLMSPILALIVKSKKPYELLKTFAKDHEDLFKNAIRALAKDPHYILHEACEKPDSSFVLLSSQLDANDIPHLNDYQFSFFHSACFSAPNDYRHESEKRAKLKKIFEQFPEDINHQNTRGDTPLHCAYRCNDIISLRYLIENKADTTIINNEGLIYSSVPGSIHKLDLGLYRSFQKNGKVISYPPEIIQQVGLTCGFYAVASVSHFFHNTIPGKFTTKHLPARKQDATEADLSLRKLGKELGITEIGPILSTRKLQELISKTECTSLIMEISNERDFQRVIENAIRRNFPLIIPYSYDLKNPSAKKAHWSVIIGCILKRNQAFILLSNLGHYENVSARELYRSFNTIEDKYAGSIAVKTPEKNWIIDNEQKYTDSPFRKHVIPETSLEDFRRKLIIVLPPGSNPELIKSEMIDEISSVNRSRR